MKFNVFILKDDLDNKKRLTEEKKRLEEAKKIASQKGPLSNWLEYLF